MQCGLCDKVVTVPEDRRVKNRLQFFKKNHYNKYVAGAVVFRIHIILILFLRSDCEKKIIRFRFVILLWILIYYIYIFFNSSKKYTD